MSRVVAKNGRLSRWEWKMHLILADAGILPKGLSEKLNKAKRFRNVLVYEYVSIEQEHIHKALQYDLQDLQQYVGLVAGIVLKKSEFVNLWPFGWEVPWEEVVGGVIYFFFKYKEVPAYCL